MKTLSIATLRKNFNTYYKAISLRADDLKKWTILTSKVIDPKNPKRKVTPEVYALCDDGNLVRFIDLGLNCLIRPVEEPKLIEIAIRTREEKRRRDAIKKAAMVSNSSLLKTNNVNTTIKTVENMETKTNYANMESAINEITSLVSTAIEANMLPVFRYNSETELAMVEIFDAISGRRISDKGLAKTIAGVINTSASSYLVCSSIAENNLYALMGLSGNCNPSVASIVDFVIDEQIEALNDMNPYNDDDNILEPISFTTISSTPAETVKVGIAA